MKILVDADGCPVVDEAVALAGTYQVPILLLCDTAHRMEREGAQTIVLSQGADSVDIVLANRTQAGDVVVTQDYGLAALCLAKGARVLHQDGWEYTPDNIDGLLLVRHTACKLRRSGGRLRAIPKRTRAQDLAFCQLLEQVLEWERASRSSERAGRRHMKEKH